MCSSDLVKSQYGGQDDAHRQLGAIGSGDGVTDALAVKKYIGFGVDGHAIDVLGRHRKGRLLKPGQFTG